MTIVRRAVLELFKEAPQPLAASDLIKELKEQGISCNRTTVFRELTSLSSIGILRAVDFGDGVRRYESSAHPHHHHFICTACNSVTDINLKNDLDTEERLLEKIYQVDIKSHSLEFFGTCRSCRGGA